MTASRHHRAAAAPTSVGVDLTQPTLPRTSTGFRVDTERVDPLDFALEGPVVEWRGPAPFYFLRVSPEDSADIKVAAQGVEYWGQVPVLARVDGVDFTTALFPKDGCYLVPLKDAVRKRAGIELGQSIVVELSVGRA